MGEPEVTTLMFRTVPRRYTASDMAEELERIVPREAFDFVYLPGDRKTCSSMRYAFVNFVDAVTANWVQVSMNGRPWKLMNRARPVRIVPAHIQGLSDNLRQLDADKIDHVHSLLVTQGGCRIDFATAVERFAKSDSNPKTQDQPRLNLGRINQPFCSTMSTQSTSEGSSAVLDGIDFSSQNSEGSSESPVANTREHTAGGAKLCAPSTASLVSLIQRGGRLLQGSGGRAVGGSSHEDGDQNYGAWCKMPKAMLDEATRGDYPRSTGAESLSTVCAMTARSEKALKKSAKVGVAGTRRSTVAQDMGGNLIRTGWERLSTQYTTTSYLQDVANNSLDAILRRQPLKGAVNQDLDAVLRSDAYKVAWHRLNALLIEANHRFLEPRMLDFPIEEESEDRRFQ